ncbi:MAG: hypothetical protein HKN39_01690 [Flavobacteriales bacterium]|nr:hypothetical protein [Flavobacteriales bacterium]
MNNLAQRVYTSIYKTRKKGILKFSRFWKHELPLIMWESRKELLVSFMIVLVCSLIGAFSSYHDSSFAQYILGEDYITITESNIADEDPMGIYKYDYVPNGVDANGEVTYEKVVSNPFSMAYRIGLNNLRVAFITFALGILWGIGTGFILISNGVMLGVFQFFFIARGLTKASVLTIWMHGTPEIAAIILAGAAGFTMGRGLLFPKTYSRQEAFVVSAKKGITIMLGITPVIIFAALVEGFITRYTEIPDILRFAIIAMMLGCIIYYFVIYPRRQFRDVDTRKFMEDHVPESAYYKTDITKIKNNGQVYGDVVKLLGKGFGKILGLALFAGLVYFGALILYYGRDIQDVVHLTYGDRIFNAMVGQNFFTVFFGIIAAILFRHFEYIDLLFSIQEFPFLYFINSIVFGLVSTYGICLALTEVNKEKYKKLWPLFIRNIYKGLIVSFIINLLFWLWTPIPFFILILVFPLFIAPLVVTVIESVDPFKGWSRTFAFWTIHYGKMIGLYLIMLLSSFVFFMILNSTVQFLLFDMVGWFVVVDDEMYSVVISSFLAIITVMGMVFTGALMFYGYVVQYYSQKEIYDAENLKEQIENLGNRDKKYDIISKVG